MPGDYQFEWLKANNILFFFLPRRESKTRYALDYRQGIFTARSSRVRILLLYNSTSSAMLFITSELFVLTEIIPGDLRSLFNVDS
jgi:hypothetical protein